ncbi:lipoprotein N-acyltransferase Lnb domain-containing protein [Dyella sp. Tek66A03]|uniref:lipoprotein N-acyltransferase Lnb domain-containing protein n=1 Tax=Dyella sp. Tek66A03 TaxID=3458298 RepID=UPI00403E9DF8
MPQALHRFAAGIALLLCCLLGWPSHAWAGVADAPGSSLEVSLITYGPGETYWERFGHDAIELRDSVSGEAISFNYGVFDFDERGFLLNFARGRMNYLMDAAPSDVDQHYYVDVGRSVTRQKLAFTPAQAADLRDFLLWNLRPENVRYRYDYYADNCATRVRDALDKALGGALREQLKARAGSMTFRQQTARLMSQQAWLMLILDLGLGPYADQPLSAWQESFLPMELQTSLRDVKVSDGQGGMRPLVIDEQVLSPNRLVPPPDSAPDLRLPLAFAGLIFAALLVLARRFAPTVYALLGSLYLVLAGIVGTVLLILWTLTAHQSAWANANLLLFNPLAFLLLRAVWRSRRGARASRFADALIVLQLLAVLAAILLHLLPGIVQQNQPWLLFALPAWLGVAWITRGQHRSPPSAP